MACVGVSGVGVFFRAVVSGKATTCQWIALHPEYGAHIVFGAQLKERVLLVDLGQVWGGMRSDQSTQQKVIDELITILY